MVRARVNRSCHAFQGRPIRAKSREGASSLRAEARRAFRVGRQCRVASARATRARRIAGTRRDRGAAGRAARARGLLPRADRRHRAARGATGRRAARRRSFDGGVESGEQARARPRGARAHRTVGGRRARALGGRPRSRGSRAGERARGRAPPRCPRLLHGTGGAERKGTRARGLGTGGPATLLSGRRGGRDRPARRPAVADPARDREGPVGAKVGEGARDRGLQLRAAGICGADRRARSPALEPTGAGAARRAADVLPPRAADGRRGGLSRSPPAAGTGRPQPARLGRGRLGGTRKEARKAGARVSRSGGVPPRRPGRRGPAVSAASQVPRRADAPRPAPRRRGRLDLPCPGRAYLERCGLRCDRPRRAHGGGPAAASPEAARR